MKKTGVINTSLSRVISELGHTDKLAIGDAGMPVPKGTEKIDLAVSANLPSFIDVLKNVLLEMEVQEVILADEIRTKNPKQLTAVRQIFPDALITLIPHAEMKKDLANTVAFVRTGEMSPYSNIILVSGVTF